MSEPVPASVAVAVVVSAPSPAQSRTQKYKILGEHYKMGKKIGEGSFGVIHEGINLLTNQYIAVKLELSKTNDPQLHDEFRIYRHLAGTHGIPKVHWYGAQEECNVLCIDLLGPSLEDLFDSCGRRFSVKTVAMLARQMIARIQSVHGRDIIYRDIKPDNFLIGLPGTHDEVTVHLIDFGLAKLYRDPKSKKHIPFVDKKNVTGTARYMSVQTHMGSEQARRDDLESLGFVFMYFLRGRLPWQGINAETNTQRNEMIGQRKRTIPIEELCAGYPDEFAEYLRYVRTIKFEEEPNYAYLMKLFEGLLERSGETEDFMFDWMLPSAAQTKETAQTNQSLRTPAAVSKRAMHGSNANPPIGVGLLVGGEILIPVHPPSANNKNNNANTNVESKRTKRSSFNQRLPPNRVSETQGLNYRTGSVSNTKKKSGPHRTPRGASGVGVEGNKLESGGGSGAGSNVAGKEAQKAGELTR